MAAPEIERLIELMAKLPGLGPRSARRAVLHLINRRSALMQPLTAALAAAVDAVAPCDECGNLDARNPCSVCADPRRAAGVICVVEGVADLWALERTASFKGRYHVLGGSLSAIDGIGPEELNVAGLLARAAATEVKEVILALNATVDGQTTAHYLSERLSGCGVAVSGLSHGIPVGGELDYMDDGTLSMALSSRRPVS
jgi:recombination protein RecR